MQALNPHNCYQHNLSIKLLYVRPSEEDPNHDHDFVTVLVLLRLGHHIVPVPGLHLDIVLRRGPTRTVDKPL